MATQRNEKGRAILQNWTSGEPVIHAGLNIQSDLNTEVLFSVTQSVTVTGFSKNLKFRLIIACYRKDKVKRHSCLTTGWNLWNAPHFIQNPNMNVSTEKEKSKTKEKSALSPMTRSGYISISRVPGIYSKGQCWQEAPDWRCTLFWNMQATFHLILFKEIHQIFSTQRRMSWSTAWPWLTYWAPLLQTKTSIMLNIGKI